MATYLAHYGILGMHWGVRRYQPYPKGEKHKGTFLGEDSVRRKNKREYRIQKLKGKVDAQTSKYNATDNVKTMNRADKKINRYTKKAAYLRELNEPGSTKLSDKTLKIKAAKNIAVAAYYGSGIVGDYLNAGYAGVVAASVAPYNPPVAAIMAISAISSATVVPALHAKITVDAARRVKSINKSFSKRNAERAQEAGMSKKKKASF